MPLTLEPLLATQPLAAPAPLPLLTLDRTAPVLHRRHAGRHHLLTQRQPMLIHRPAEVHAVSVKRAAPLAQAGGAA